MVRQRDVETFYDHNKLDSEWWDKVNIAIQNANDWQEIVKTRWPNFNKWEIKFWVTFTWPNMHWTNHVVLRAINYALYPAGSEARHLKKMEMDKKDPHEQYVFCTVRVGLADLICLEWGEITTLLYQLQKPDRSDLQKHLPNPYTRKFLDYLGEVCILSTLDANSSCWKIQMGARNKNTTFHMEPWTVQFFTDVIQYEERTKQVPTLDGHCTVKFQVTLVFLDIFLISSKSVKDHLDSTDSIETTLESQRIIETEDILLLRRGILLLFCSENMLKDSVYQRSAWCGLYTTITYEFEWIQVVSWCFQPILKVFITLCKHSRTVEP